jgi:16S rRNA (guanine527-N7)-methyltransferase
MHSATPLTDRAALYAQLCAGASELGVALSVEASERLLDYLDLLTRWNGVYNLTAVRVPAEMVTRHLLDSLAIAPHVHGETLIDLGTGAGLPGIPLAILDEDRAVTLVDSNGKKTRFLREAVRTLGLRNVRIEQVRVEDARGQFDCVVARAFASIAELLASGGHLIAPGGVCLAMKGLLKVEEVTALPAGFKVTDVVALNVPGLSAARHVVVIRAIVPDREDQEAAILGRTSLLSRARK